MFIYADEQLLDPENYMYNNIHSIITLLENNKKVLLIGKICSGKSYTIDKINNCCPNNNFIYYDDIIEKVSKKLLESKQGIICTVQGGSIREGIYRTSELTNISVETLRHLFDYCIFIKDGYYIIRDCKKLEV